MSRTVAASELITTQIKALSGDVAKYTQAMLSSVVSELHGISPTKVPSMIRLQLPTLYGVEKEETMILPALMILTDNDAQVCRVREAIRRRLSYFNRFEATAKLSRPQIEDCQLIMAVATMLVDRATVIHVQFSIYEMYTAGQEQARTQRRQHARF
jgi:hypothetical protein